VEAVETRVPYGKQGMRIVLSAGLLYTLLALLRNLFVEFLFPIAQSLISVISGARPLPHLFSQANSITILVYSLAGVMLSSLILWFRYLLSKTYAEVKALEKAIENYRSIFWQPMTADEKTTAIAELKALGKHTVIVTAHENTDCVELARDVRECFHAADWDLMDSPLTGTWASAAASGLTAFGKDPALTPKVMRILTTPHHLTGKRTVQGPRSGFDSDIVIIVGPKRLRDD